MNKIFFALLLGVALQANASSFEAPARLKFTNSCLWVNQNALHGEPVRYFSQGHCEMNYARITGVRFYRSGKKECVATTGKRVVLTDYTGIQHLDRTVHPVKKPVVSCFDPYKP